MSIKPEAEDILNYITNNVDLSRRMEKEIRLALIRRDIEKRYSKTKTKKEMNEIYKIQLTHLDKDGKKKTFKPNFKSRSTKKTKKTKKGGRSRKRR